MGKTLDKATRKGMGAPAKATVPLAKNQTPQGKGKQALINEKRGK